MGGMRQTTNQRFKKEGREIFPALFRFSWPMWCGGFLSRERPSEKVLDRFRDGVEVDVAVQAIPSLEPFFVRELSAGVAAMAADGDGSHRIAPAVLYSAHVLDRRHAKARRAGPRRHVLAAINAVLIALADALQVLIGDAVVFRISHLLGLLWLKRLSKKEGGEFPRPFSFQWMRPTAIHAYAPAIKQAAAKANNKRSMMSALIALRARR
jgi:hypothetical protein